MAPEYRNIYQIARESAGFTQEKAAELLDISVESLRAYESGRRVPPDRIVIIMIEIYDTQYLAYQHLKTSAEVGQEFMPNIELRDLPSAVLNLLKEVNDLVIHNDEIIEITCDGIIDQDERPRWNAILEKLKKLESAIMSLRFAKITQKGGG